MLFIKYQDNWADEMNVIGGAIMTEIAYADYISDARKAFEKRPIIDFPVGSNEWIEYSNFDEFIRTLTVYTISEQEEQVLRRFLTNGWDSFGQFPEELFIDEEEE